MSPRLIELHERGLFGPYREKNQAGLTVRDCRAQTLLRTRVPERVYERFEEVPPLLVNALLFVEDRHLLDAQPPQRNPAIDPERFAKAALEQTHRALDARARGLRRQHAGHPDREVPPFARTAAPASVGDKLRQMASASLRAYQDGDDTLARRRQIVVDYLDTVPLAATSGIRRGARPGRRPVGLVRPRLRRSQPPAGRHRRRGRAPDEALRAPGRSLQAGAVADDRAAPPSQHLLGNGDEPGAAHRQLPAADGARPASSRRRCAMPRCTVPAAAAGRAAGGAAAGLRAAQGGRTRCAATCPRCWTCRASTTSTASTSRPKPASTARRRRLRRDVLTGLRTPAAAKSAGLFGYHLLDPGADPSPLIYSFTLFERGAARQPAARPDRQHRPALRRQRGRPAGPRLDGQAAHAGQLPRAGRRAARALGRARRGRAFAREARADRDPLGAWARRLPAARQGPRACAPMLEAAMERRYSASPGEAFFTGGGAASLRELRRTRRPAASMTVREALQALGQPGVHPPDARHRAPRMFGAGRRPAPAAGPERPAPRASMLARFADREGAAYLARFHRKYKGKSAAEAEDAAAARRAAIGAAPGQRAVHDLEPEAGDAQLDALLDAQARPRRRRRRASCARCTTVLRRRCRSPTAATSRACIRSSSGWSATCAGIRGATLAAGRSTPARASARRSTRWLFKTRHKSAQDRRIRELLELDAFAQIHRSWQRLGYPFASLTPSYATRDRRFGRPAGGAGRADGHHRQRRHAAAGAARRRAALRTRHALRDAGSSSAARRPEQVLPPEVAAAVRAR